MNKSTSTPKKAKNVKGAVKKSENNENYGIFTTLKSLFKIHIPPLKVTVDTEKKFEVVTDRHAIFHGIQRDNMYFGSLIIHPSYVGLYLMFTYTHTQEIKKLGADLRNALKGKSCFHIKKLNETLLKEIDEALTNGILCYKKENLI